jgi:hypothetical protein
MTILYPESQLNWIDASFEANTDHSEGDLPSNKFPKQRRLAFQPTNMSLWRRRRSPPDASW